MIQPLILIAYGIFLILWGGDIYFTYYGVKRYGSSVELNPILKSIIGVRRQFLGIFKVIEFCIFTYLVWQLMRLNEEHVFNILLGLILLYSVVVSAGIKVYIDSEQGSSAVVAFVFLLSLCLLTSIYFIHMEYENRVVLASALMDCISTKPDTILNSTVENAIPKQDWTLVNQALGEALQ
jgi:hypothetical protein